MTNQWLASGGAYLLLFVGWAMFALAGIVTAISIGKRTEHESDGCLLAIGNLVVTLAGGGIGLQIVKFPFFVLTSLLLAGLFPATLTFVWFRRTIRPPQQVP